MSRPRLSTGVLVEAGFVNSSSKEAFLSALEATMNAAADVFGGDFAAGEVAAGGFLDL